MTITANDIGKKCRMSNPGYSVVERVLTKIVITNEGVQYYSDEDGVFSECEVMPEPKYRPYANAKEVPKGLRVHRKGMCQEGFCTVFNAGTGGVMVMSNGSPSSITYKELLDNWEDFDTGLTLGVKE